MLLTHVGFNQLLSTFLATFQPYPSVLYAVVGCLWLANLETRDKIKEGASAGGERIAYLGL
jgi:hypothetical protein